MKKPNPLLEKFSKIISTAFNPIFSLVAFFIYNFYQQPTGQSFSTTFLPLLLGIILPIILWIFWNVKRGKYTDSDVSNQEQRNSLYLVIVGLLCAFLVWDHQANQNIDIKIAFLLLLFLLMMLSNFFIKSSMHTAFNIYVSTLFFAINPMVGGIWLVLTAFVAYTRIVLKRHTPKEIIAGTCIASIVSFIYLYSNILLNLK